MALEDVTKLIAPRRPALVLKILMAFYGKQALTREELLSETGLKPKSLEYYITKIRRFRLIEGSRSGGIYRYHVSIDGFHARIDTLFVDSVKTLAKGGERR